jgi:hypothetical protein
MAKYQASSNPYSSKFGPQSPFSQQYDYAWKQQQLAQQTAEDDFARYRKQLQEQALEQASQKAAEDIRKRYQGYIPEEIKSVEKVGPSELQDVLARQKAGLEGYSAPQLAAMQAQMAQGQQAAQVARERALQAALAKQNIRGGAAASLQAQLGMQAGRERAAQDTEMMLKQAAKQEEALKGYREGVLGSLDIAQRKQFTDLATKLAAEQAAAAEAASRRQQAGIESYGESMSKASRKIICTELYHQGLMPIEIYEADQKFGEQLLKSDPEVMRGYHMWAVGVVNLMKKSKAMTYVVKWIATPWSKHMAHQMGVVEKPNYVGACLMYAGLKFCRFVSKFQKKEVSHA